MECSYMVVLPLNRRPRSLLMLCGIGTGQSDKPTGFPRRLVMAYNDPRSTYPCHSHVWLALYPRPGVAADVG